MEEVEGSLVRMRISDAEKINTKSIEPKVRSGSATKNDKDGKYYLVRLEMEYEKLKALIEQCEQDLRLTVPDEVSGHLRNAIGKARLLINKRFKQFTQLCNDNIEQDPTKKATKSSDLTGYWDMMYIQVEDVKKLFSDIDEMKANGWKVKEKLKVENGNSTPTSKRRNPNSKENLSSPRTASPRRGVVDDSKAKKEARQRLAAHRKRMQEQKQKESLSNGDSIEIKHVQSTPKELCNDEASNKEPNNEKEEKDSIKSIAENGTKSDEDTAMTQSDASQVTDILSDASQTDEESIDLNASGELKLNSSFGAESDLESSLNFSLSEIQAVKQKYEKLGDCKGSTVEDGENV